MISEAIGAGGKRIIDAIVRGLARSRINPNALTTTGLLINIGCSFLYGYGFFFIAGLVMILRTADQLRKMAATNPFKKAQVTPDTRLYVTFLAERTKTRLKIPYESPKKDFRILKTTDAEIFTVVDASKGSGTLESMAFIEKEFGKQSTTRNWNTINRMLEVISPARAE